jgi:hypothetical protein
MNSFANDRQLSYFDTREVGSVRSMQTQFLVCELSQGRRKDDASTRTTPNAGFLIVFCFLIFVIFVISFLNEPRQFLSGLGAKSHGLMVVDAIYSGHMLRDRSDKLSDVRVEWKIGWDATSQSQVAQIRSFLRKIGDELTLGCVCCSWKHGVEERPQRTAAGIVPPGIDDSNLYIRPIYNLGLLSWSESEPVQLELGYTPVPGTVFVQE